MAKYRKCDIMQAIAIARADFREANEEVFETLRDEMKREGEIEGNEMEIIY